MNKIVHLLNKQLTEAANDKIAEIIENIPFDELEHVTDEFEAMELLQDCIDCNNEMHEAFYYWDTYYSETAGRGNAYEVATVLREEIENELGCFEFDFDTSEEAIHMTANNMVNIYAEVFGPHMWDMSSKEVFDLMQECLK
jgi:hypothetical protein